MLALISWPATARWFHDFAGLATAGGDPDALLLHGGTKPLLGGNLFHGAAAAGGSRKSPFGYGTLPIPLPAL